jgi:hypothetical protein
MSEINPGDVVTVSTSPGFKNAAGVLADPTTVTLKWRVFSDDDLTTWVYGTDSQVVKDSTGLYHADIPVTKAGRHYFRWEGDGTVTAAEEGSFLAVTKF